MKVYAQKQNQPQQQASHNVTRSGAEPLAASRILYLQRTIGNQAVQRLLHANAEGPEVDSATSATTRFAHAFSRILVFSKSPIRLQAKLKVNTPGDIYEQEADRISEQVMRMPEPQLQHTCACGGCAKCQNEQDAHEHLQSKGVQADDIRKIEAPPIVNEVLHSSGQPLNRTTQGFMESRFGHDFSRVRVHTDVLAAASARAVQAQAYTVGRDVVFGAGQFAPGTAAGRRLLAHELTHTIQQTGRLQRKSDVVIERQEMSEQEPGLDDTALAVTDIEPEDEEITPENESADACQRLIDEPLTEVSRETGVEEVSARVPGGNGKKPKLKFHFWLIRYLNPKYWGPGGRSRFECDFAFANPYKQKKPPRGKRRKTKKKQKDHKDRITCITKYKVTEEQLVVERQPDVKNQRIDRDYNLNDSDCTYIVRWNMKEIPDQMIIMDNDTGAVILDTGMKAGEGEHKISGPANIHIRVIPNDGTDNPKNEPTIYNYKIIQICKPVKKITTCYWLGFIPIGRIVRSIRFDPDADYSRTKQGVSRAKAKRLLGD